jgi:hypothetical protein
MSLWANLRIIFMIQIEITSSILVKNLIIGSSWKDWSSHQQNMKN